MNSPRALFGVSFFVFAALSVRAVSAAACDASSFVPRSAGGSVLTAQKGLYVVDRPVITLALRSTTPSKAWTITAPGVKTAFSVGDSLRLLLGSQITQIVHATDGAATCEIIVLSVPLDKAQESYGVALVDATAIGRSLDLPALRLGAFTLLKPDVQVTNSNVRLSGFLQIAGVAKAKASSYVSFVLDEDGLHSQQISVPLFGNVSLAVRDLRCKAVWSDTSCTYSAEANVDNLKLTAKNGRNTALSVNGSITIGNPDDSNDRKAVLALSNAQYDIRTGVFSGEGSICLTLAGKAISLKLTQLAYAPASDGLAARGTLRGRVAFVPPLSDSQGRPDGGKAFVLQNATGSFTWDAAGSAVRIELDSALIHLGESTDGNSDNFFGVDADVRGLSMLVDANGPRFDATHARLTPLAGRIFGREVAPCKTNVAGTGTAAVANRGERDGEDPMLCVGVHLMPGSSSSDDDVANVLVGFGPQPSGPGLPVDYTRPSSLAVRLPDGKPARLRVGGTVFGISSLDLRTGASASSALRGASAQIASEDTSMETGLPGYSCVPYVQGSVTISSVSFGSQTQPLAAQPTFEFGNDCFRLELVGYLPIQVGDRSSVTLTRVVAAHQRVNQPIKPWSLPVTAAAKRDARYRGVACMPSDVGPNTSDGAGGAATTAKFDQPKPAVTESVVAANGNGTTVEYDRLEAAGTITSGNVSAVFRRVGFQREDRCRQRWYTFYDLDPGMTFGLNAVQNSDQIGKALTALGGALAAIFLKH